VAGAATRTRRTRATGDTDMCNKNNQFRSTRNGSNYICKNCVKRTRESGNCESSLKQCLACNLEGEIQIMMSDYRHNFTAEQSNEFQDRLTAANAMTSEANTKAIRQIHEQVMAIAYV
jgi:hypothetical protein